MLAGHAEQMALVVMQHLTIGARPEQAVAMAAIGRLDDHTAGNYCVQPRSLSAQPGIGRPLFRLSQRRRIHGKTGGEHLRQHHQVRAAGLIQQGGEAFVVGGSVLPYQAGLHQREFEVGQIVQIAHSRSAA